MLATARAHIRAVTGLDLQRQNASSTADRPFRQRHVVRGVGPSGLLPRLQREKKGPVARQATGR